MSERSDVYKRQMEDGGEEWDAHEVALDTVSFSYPMRISLVLIMERKPKHLMPVSYTHLETLHLLRSEYSAY